MRRSAFATILFGITIFVGAFLLFQVQPLIGKYILPWFGGTPAVWTTCMLFFQVMLLVGYAYAHASVRFLSPKAQVLLHIVLLVIALFMLPISPSPSWAPSGGADENPTLRIIGLLIASLGLPYVMLASTGPLLQNWFSEIRPGDSPYRLYALSNVASLLALVSYPFFFEPRLTRTAQASIWGWTLAVFVVACAGTAVFYWVQSHEKDVELSPGDLNTQELVPARLRSLWLILPACASALLLAVTNMMCQDIAVIPLLWVLPLSIYLLSFIICFDNPRWYRREIFMPLMALSMIALRWALFRAALETPILIQIAIHSVALFACCMVCHGELYRLRPGPKRLTSFYLTIAAGGALGGFAVAIVAPLVLNDFYEIHISILSVALLSLVILRRDRVVTEPIGWFTLVTGLCVLALILYFDATANIDSSGAFDVRRSRNFYGVLRVYEVKPSSYIEHYRMLQHGGIRHGGEFVNPALRAIPTAYYGPRSGAGLALLNAPRNGPLHVGVIGLGVGTVLTYAQSGDRYTVYEINPDVVRIARDEFWFLRNCKAQVDMILGDARLSLARQLAQNQAQNFDVLILDAFSGDAIPVHLLTRECFEIYLQHLRPGGIIAIHISNQHLDLEPVVVKLAEHFNLKTAHIVSFPRLDTAEYLANWMLVTTDQAWLNTDPIKSATTPGMNIYGSIRLWTDDDTNLFQILN